MNAIYQRVKLERSGKPIWRYQSIEEGRGRRTGRLAGPFYMRPTVKANGTTTQPWVKLTAENFEDAKTEAEQRGAAFDAAAKGLTVAEAEAVSNTGRNPIKVAIKRFLEKKRKKTESTQANYAYILNEFSEWLPSRIRFVDQIDGDELDDYMKALEEKGATPRTVHNKVLVVCLMLKAAGVPNPTKMIEMPTIEEEEAVPYSADDLGAIFSKATTEERVRYQFFLDSACREKEVAVAEWPDIDWTKGTYHVHPKTWVSNSTGKTERFTVKTHEDRRVPLTREILGLLKTRKSDRKNLAHARWIFPNENGDPEGHFLRKFKKLAFEAGLNCGNCNRTVTVGRYTKQQKQVTCATYSEGCEKHWLHRLRKTCATFWHEQHIPLRTIQYYLGHKSLETTQKYLGVMDSAKLQEQINAPKF